MSELEQYSDSFIMNQMEYYKKNMAVHHDQSVRNHVSGLYESFKGEAARRGLIKYNPHNNRYEKVNTT